MLIRAKKYISNRKKLIFLIILVLLGVGYFIFKSKNKALEVTSYTVTKREVFKNISSSGETKTKDELTIRSKVGAKIKELPYKSGEFVGKGQSVLVLDDLSLKASVSELWQAYLTALASQQSYQTQLESSRAATKSAEYAKETAERALREHDNFDTRTTFKSADATFKSADSTLQTLISKKSSIDQAVNSSMAGYLSGKDSLNATGLVAPETGLLVLYNLNPGDVVTPGQKLFSITNAQALQFTAEVDEADIQSINVDQPVIVTLDSYPDKEFDGKVSLIDSKTRVTTSGSTIVDVIISLDFQGIKPILGMSGTAQIQIARESNLAIPFDSVLTENTKNYVFVIKDSVLEKREIKLGFEGDELYVVKEGLNENENIVAATTLTGLTNGSKVTITTK